MVDDPEQARAVPRGLPRLRRRPGRGDDRRRRRAAADRHRHRAQPGQDRGHPHQRPGHDRAARATRASRRSSRLPPPSVDPEPRVPGRGPDHLAGVGRAVQGAAQARLRLRRPDHDARADGGHRPRRHPPARLPPARARAGLGAAAGRRAQVTRSEWTRARRAMPGAASRAAGPAGPALADRRSRATSGRSGSARWRATVVGLDRRAVRRRPRRRRSRRRCRDRRRAVPRPGRRRWPRCVRSSTGGQQQQDQERQQHHDAAAEQHQAHRVGEARPGTGGRPRRSSG